MDNLGIRDLQKISLLKVILKSSVKKISRILNHNNQWGLQQRKKDTHLMKKSIVMGTTNCSNSAKFANRSRFNFHWFHPHLKQPEKKKNSHKSWHHLSSLFLILLTIITILLVCWVLLVSAAQEALIIFWEQEIG